MVLVMTVEPGFGGQSFMADQMPKVRQVREAVRRHGGEIWIQVDGGVSADTIEQCAEAGADVFVAGSAVYGAEDAAAAVDELARAGPGAPALTTPVSRRSDRVLSRPSAAAGGGVRARRRRGDPCTLSSRAPPVTLGSRTGLLDDEDEPRDDPRRGCSVADRPNLLDHDACGLGASVGQFGLVDASLSFAGAGVLDGEPVAAAGTERLVRRFRSGLTT